MEPQPGRAQPYSASVAGPSSIRNPSESVPVEEFSAAPAAEKRSAAAATHPPETTGTRALRRSGSTPRPHPLAPLRSKSVERLKPKPKPLTVSAGRATNRIVQLPTQLIPEENAEDIQSSDAEVDRELSVVPGVDGDAAQTRRSSGRITVLVVAEIFHLKKAAKELRRLYPAAEYKMYTETMYVRTAFSAGFNPGEVFVNDYGVAVCWNLTREQELEIVDDILKSCSEKPMTDDELVSHHLSFHYSAHQPPSIKNDIITIHRSQARDPEVKLSISHALAQSAKLMVYEDRILQLVEEVRHLPEEMATYGEVRMSRGSVATFMGKVFLQKSAVNLLNPVLDTPEFFWTAPDHLQMLYSKVCEYKDMEERVELVNARFEIIQAMLNIWRQHQHSTHYWRLNVIVAVLVALEVILAAFQLVE